MFRITIEIIPFGIETMKREIYKIEGININTSSNNIANYEINIKAIPKNTIKKTKIIKFNRSQGILSLLSKILEKMEKYGYK